MRASSSQSSRAFRGSTVECDIPGSTVPVAIQEGINPSRPRVRKLQPLCQRRDTLHQKVVTRFTGDGERAPSALPPSSCGEILQCATDSYLRKRRWKLVAQPLTRDSAAA